MKTNPSHNSSFLFEQCNTLAVPYFSIFNRTEPQQPLILGVLIEENPSHTLLLLLEQYIGPQPSRIFQITKTSNVTFVLTFSQGANPAKVMKI